MVPVVVGFLPFALVIGTVIADRGAGLAGWSGSWLIYGGGAHLAALRLLGTSGALIAIATATLLHTRLVLYGASLGRLWSDQPRWFRLVAAAMIIDPTWALAEQQAHRDPRSQRAHFLAAGTVLGLGWSAGIAVGAMVGSRLRLDVLDVAVPLCLVAMVVPRLAPSGERWPVVAAASAAVVTAGWPAGTSQLAAIAAGLVAGGLSDRRPR